MKRHRILLIIITLYAIQIIHIAIAAAQDKTSYVAATDLPPWVLSPPVDCFVGISESSQSIENAREQALNSAVSQIIRAMGAEYSLTHESVLSGDHTYSIHRLTERLTYTARWFLRSIQQNIKEYRLLTRPKGYLCFVLVTVTPSQLQLLCKLTIGPQIAAKGIRENDGAMLIEVKELNDVLVNLTGYNVSTLIKNRLAKIITLFAWKVPENRTQHYQGVLDNRLHLKNSTAISTIYLHSEYNRLQSLVLGAKSTTKINLTGYDEIGRQITVPVMITQ